MTATATTAQKTAPDDLRRTRMRRKLRLQLYRVQGGKCHCCGKDMWEGLVETVGAFMHRQAQAGRMLSERKVRIRCICTYEHVDPVAKGGLEQPYDVATCADCNQNRGTIPYELFRQAVREHGEPWRARILLRKARA